MINQFKKYKILQKHLKIVKLLLNANSNFVCDKSDSKAIKALRAFMPYPFGSVPRFIRQITGVSTIPSDMSPVFVCRKFTLYAARLLSIHVEMDSTYAPY